MKHTQPEIFQGRHQKNHYFEGWYFKLVTKDLLTSVAFIPGISINKVDGHSFIQIFIVHHGKKPRLKNYYLRFNSEQFVADKDQFHVSISNNTFSFNSIHINHSDKDISLNVQLKLKGITPINRGFLNPSIMGPFAYFPKMECYHGVLSLGHYLEGTMTIDDEVISFDGGKGYLEKDWGTSFPEKYVWIQANHFPEPSTSFFFSYATIPYLGFKFNGLICHFYHQGKHYRFATYNATRITKELVEKNAVQYTLKKGLYTLSLSGRVDHFVSLPSPKDGQMKQAIKEGLSGAVSIMLKKGQKVLYQGESLLAGIEIMK
jgi:tocopherol cyclase